MTEARKLKQKIRKRAQRTGESYAAARRHVVAQMDAERAAKTEATARKAQVASATGAVSEARCIEKTGHGFAHWFEVLDRFGARAAGHTKAARHLHTDLGVSAWYAQSITVAYDRAHGLREVGQRSTGDYQTSVSRVLPISQEAARDLLAEAPARDRWLAPIDGEVARWLLGSLAAGSLTPRGKTLRLRERLGETVVQLELVAKADGRSSVGVRHDKIATKEAMIAFRDQWRTILDAFRTHCRTG